MPHIFISSCLCACFLSASDNISLKQYLTNKYFAFLQYPLCYTGQPCVFSGDGDHKRGRKSRGGDHMGHLGGRPPQELWVTAKLPHISNLKGDT